MNQAVILADPDLYLEVYGRPVPQGAIRYMNGHGVHANGKKLDVWRRLVGAAARSAMYATGQDKPIDTPVAVDLTVTLDQPKASTKRGDTWPVERYCGDIDHHARACLDALVAARAIHDDALVVDLSATKVWVDGGLDALGTAGVVIRVWRLG